MASQRKGGFIHPKYRKKCKICNKVIIDRSKAARYCKEHTKAIRFIKSKFVYLLRTLMEQYPDLKISIKIKNKISTKKYENDKKRC